jgi:hypothetical protein
MASKPRIPRGVIGADKEKVGEVMPRAHAMYNGLNGDKATYSNPNPSLPNFLILIQSAAAAQELVPTRAIGAAASRDVEVDLLWTGMQSELVYVNGLARLSPLRAVAIIQNAGLVVAELNPHPKALLSLSLGNESGSVDCDANVGLLVGAGAKKPNQSRFFNWSYTVDGSKTFVTALSTPIAKTTIKNLTPLTIVGVRVSMTNSEGTGPWSDVVTIVVH